MKDTIKKLPKIYKGCAHPQSVWFEEHWRPIFEEQSQALSRCAEIISVYEEAYQTMRDAACLALDCECSVDDRLSGHKNTCQVPHIEFKINHADEALAKAKEIIKAGER